MEDTSYTDQFNSMGFYSMKILKNNGSLVAILAVNVLMTIAALLLYRATFKS